MNEPVKIDLKINRKTVLLLSSVVEGGTGKDGAQVQELLKLVPGEDVEELKLFADECLKKAGLTELSDKMKMLAKLGKSTGSGNKPASGQNLRCKTNRSLFYGLGAPAF